MKIQILTSFPLNIAPPSTVYDYYHRGEPYHPIAGTRKGVWRSDSD
jgi:hypothetical protein